MNIPFAYHTFFAGLALFFAVLAFGRFRLPALVRYYGLSSLCLALLSFFLPAAGGIHEGSSHLWLFGVATLLVKVLFIPWLILYVARRSGALLRLQSFLRPAPSYFLAALLLLLTFFIIVRSSLAVDTGFIWLLYVSVSLVLLGIAMMIVRRDLFSQIMGFLVLENGLALFGIVTVGSLPILIELGIFLVITTSALIMSTVSRHVQELYGTGDTEKLRELID